MLTLVSKQLGAAYDVVVATDPAAVDAAIRDIDVVLDAYMKVPFPRSRLDLAPRLQLFVAATTGADHVDDANLAQRSIPLLTLQGQNDVLRNLTPAAEHSWLLLMACARRLIPAAAHVRDGGWDRNLFPGIMLRGKTLGLVGCGRIGQWMAHYADAFGMSSVGFDPNLVEWPGTIQRASSLIDMLPVVDFLSIHVPLTEMTKGLLGYEELRLLKPTAILINTSRGEVVDSEALVAMIDAGSLQGVGVDVLDGEPKTGDHPLVDLARRSDRVLITPHIGGFSPDALKIVLSFSCDRIRQYFANV